MPTESGLFIGMFNNLAIFIVMVFVYGVFIDHFRQTDNLKSRLVLGLSFGAIALLCMHARIPAGEGVIVDQRNTVVVLAGAFGGPIPAIISATMAGIYRLYLGGAGALSGIAGVSLAALAGFGLYRFFRAVYTLPHAAAGAFVATLIILPGFLVYKDLGTGWALLQEVGPTFGTAIFIGIFLGILLMAREHRRHKAETALKISEDRFRDFAESASDWFWETDESNRFIFLSDEEARRAIVQAADGAEGETEEAGLNARFRHALETREDFRGLILHYADGSGESRYIAINGVPQTNRDGAFRGYRGTATDVTERLRAENQVREREQRYRSVIATAQDGFWVAGLDGRLFEVNDAYVRRSGYSRDELLSMYISDLNAEDDVADVATRMDTLKRQGRGFYTTRHRTKGGEIWEVEASIAYVEIEGGRLFSFLRDISERKSMERQLVRAQKLEAVGQLSGGIAHDFNNLLNIISLNAGILKTTAEEGSQTSKFVEAILSAVTRGADLTRKLLGFSRTETADTKRVSVNELIVGMEDLLSRSLTPAIRVETALADDAWPVDINPGDFEDTILNLGLNAGDAMPDGGTLVIETANKVIDEHYVERNPGSRAGDFMMISVSDSGRGMSADVVERAFEPFFSTKEEGKGSGLGLAMVYGFVQRSGGHAKIYSEIGEGTTMRFYLPRAEGTVTADVPAETTPTETPMGTETILIVDDEQALVEAAATILGSLGYTTLGTNTATDALAMIEGDADIDLLFSDVIMPGGMDGYELAIEALQRRPDLKIQLTSGFAKKRETLVNGNGRIGAELAANLLHKPYNRTELAVAIRRTLDRRK